MPAARRTRLRGLSLDVYKSMGKAVADHDMLADNDHILVAVSGGVDSLSLLELFLLRQVKIPIKIRLTACFVDVDFIDFDTAALEEYFKSRGVEYVIKPLVLTGDKIDCFWCSWNRRKCLFETARELGCNKIALGHHMDDIAQTILMNMFYRGEISTCPANLEMFGGEIRLLRPLCYVEKKDLREFAAQFAFPKDDFICPYGKTSKREEAKSVIEQLEKTTPYVKKNIIRSLTNIKEGYLA